MKLATSIKEHSSLLSSFTQREFHEKSAEAAVTTEILGKLNIDIEKLPQKAQQILHNAAEAQISLHLDELDPIAVSLLHSKQASENLEHEYEILKLKQKNAQLQMEIERNNKFLEELRKDLACSRDSLMAQSPNPENIQDHIRQLRLKVASYEENCAKAKAKFTKLSVPDGVLPRSLMAQAASLAARRAEAAALRRRAEDVTLAREARQTLCRLRR